MFEDLVLDLIANNRKREIIEYSQNFNEYSRYNFLKELGASGLEIIDQVSLEKTSRVVSYMLKNLGKNFLAGKNLTQISLPIYLNDERTMLEL